MVKCADALGAQVSFFDKFIVEVGMYHEETAIDACRQACTQRIYWSSFRLA